MFLQFSNIFQTGKRKLAMRCKSFFLCEEHATFAIRSLSEVYIELSYNCLTIVLQRQCVLLFIFSPVWASPLPSLFPNFNLFVDSYFENSRIMILLCIELAPEFSTKWKKYLFLFRDLETVCKIPAAFSLIVWPLDFLIRSIYLLVSLEPSSGVPWVCYKFIIDCHFSCFYFIVQGLT